MAPFKLHFTARVLRSGWGCQNVVLPAPACAAPRYQPQHDCSFPVPAAGNVRWSWDNTTITCFQPPAASSPPPPPSTPAHAAEQLAEHQTATVGVAGTANELLFLLSSPNVTRIVMAGVRGARNGGKRETCISSPALADGCALPMPRC